MINHYNVIVLAKLTFSELRCRVVKVVDYKPLAPNRCWFESPQGLRIPSCEEAIQLAYITAVIILRGLFLHLRGTWGVGSRHITIRVLKRNQKNVSF
jgi:hypothetical protein